jgi:PAS domain-containing protein
MPFVEEVFLRSDGRPIHVDMMGQPFLLQDRWVVHLVIRDVTRRKEAEAATRRARMQRLAAVALLALGLVAAAGYHGYEYTESTRFCAEQCHSVMQPEAALHRPSSHAHVTCAQCHIGEGAAWYVKAKISGLHQVYATLAETYHRPIPAPIVNLRPASETCERCHSPYSFHGNVIRVFRSVAEDGNVRDPKVTAVLLHVGGYRPGIGNLTGIHWHVGLGNKLEYLATDTRRKSIREIRARRADGTSVEYRASGATRPGVDSAWRVMDCSDCHNRVPHNYQEPEVVVDRLLLDGRLPAALPQIKKVALAVLRREYATRPAAESGILAGLREYYRREYPDVAARDNDLLSAASTLYREAYASNIYPALKIGWNTYPSNLGHRAGPGCFRCHDGEHRTADGRVLPQDCDLCHAVLADGMRQSALSPTVRQLLFSR